MPLANALQKRPQEAYTQARYPLELVFCPSCCLLQITETVSPEILFRDYLYFSSYSETMLKHARALASRVIRERGLNAQSLVVELASNDGYLLKNYVSREIPVLGVEPAQNVARIAEEMGVPTLVDFFDASLGARLATEGRRADVVHAHNVLAHVSDSNSFARGIAHLLQPTGVAIIEVPYISDLIEGCEFDTIYHEHLSYFSLSALDRLFSRNNLTVRDVERVNIHGGSLRILVDRLPGLERSEAFNKLYTAELEWGVQRASTYRGVAERVRAVRDELRTTLRSLKQEGKTIAAYGAAAKGATLLNYIGIGSDVIDFVVDRSPHKQGLYMPGLGIPIKNTEHLAEVQPDFCLLLAWNFADEIMGQQSRYRERGGRFIIPLPRPRIL